ncbi:TRAP transporter small permease [Aeoliella mucimassa]|uniref:2,3-diketo-L-gulonate TRAP transporter small permease protein YiaM n=1 Tax=Aeoliella mucimassa TaxID=2527972 RepID=A0A518AME0_9BACT|nr:TRAP transporter small permease [Aeoliella mucimassa]QDU55890.1 2,3-diketo-L-gulonate TRAP transporter small permease protein YiaM [Aeoliella mucimassa]
MMKVLHTIEKLVLRLLEWAVIVLISALVLDVLWQVTTRFVLKDPSKWTVELASYSMAWLSMLGTAVAFAHREHLGLDYFKLKLHGDAQRVASILSQLVVIAFAAWVMLGGGVRLVSEVLATGQSSAALGIPMGAVYLATPIAGGCVVLFAVVDLLELIVSPVEETPDRSPP